MRQGEKKIDEERCNKMEGRQLASNKCYYNDMLALFFLHTYHSMAQGHFNLVYNSMCIL